MQKVLLKLRTYFIICTVRSLYNRELGPQKPRVPVTYMEQTHNYTTAYRLMIMSGTHDVINSRLSASTHIPVTPDIIVQCIHKPMPGKEDGDLRSKSYHIINGSYSVHVLLSLLYNIMSLHELLKYLVISISKDVQVYLPNIGNYISLFNCICKLYDDITSLLYRNYLSTSDMELGYNKMLLNNNVYIDLHSTRRLLINIINNSSDMYSYLLDASKAFI